MFAFDVLVNGERILTAGIEDWGLIHADVVANRSRGPDEEDVYELSVSGVAQQVAKGKIEHVRWGRRPLSVGDEVTFRLVEAAKADVPIKRYRSDINIQENPLTEGEIRQMNLETYLHLKKIFEKD